MHRPPANIIESLIIVSRLVFHTPCQYEVAGHITANLASEPYCSLYRLRLEDPSVGAADFAAASDAFAAVQVFVAYDVNA